MSWVPSDLGPAGLAHELTWGLWCRQVDSDQLTLIVGFGDGVVRLLKELKDSLFLLHVFKPHTLPVTAVAFSPDGNTLATGSQDGTIFFMGVTKDSDGHASQLSPIGFISLAKPVCSISWCPDGTKLLACVAGTGLLEIKRPVEAELDTSATFEISLQMREYPFELKRIVPEKPPPKETEDGEEVPPEPEPEIPPTGEATAVVWCSPTSFLVSYDGVETSGKVYECSFDYKYPIREMDTHSAPVSLLRFSHSGRYLISGSIDGQVAIRPLAQDTPDSLFFLQKCWKGTIHGIDAKVTGAGLTFDEQKLVTCAVDGNVHMFSVAEQFQHLVCIYLCTDVFLLTFLCQARIVCIHASMYACMFARGRLAFTKMTCVLKGDTDVGEHV
jgi:WD40 repeat protein